MVESEGLLNFDHPKEQAPIIKVLGVGGGGSNAVNHMYRQGIHGVDFVICNTDAQAIATSPVPLKIQLGNSLTAGNGAGSKPEVGMNAAIENLEDIREILSKDTKMVFITAGMGGGTGTGGAPVIAKLAREMEILTIGIVTIPFAFEGRKRRQLADQGIQELRQHVDTLLVINNDKLRELHGNLELGEAFAKADNILTDAAKGIAEIITQVGYINVDFEDVKTVMKDSGVAIMGTGIASGENRAMEAVEGALSSPLLNDNQITGASNVLLYIASGTTGIRLDEVTEITDYIQMEAGSNAEIIWGNGNDPSLGEGIAVTIIATGFQTNPDYDLVQTKSRKNEILVGEINSSESPKNILQKPSKAEEDMHIVQRPSPTDYTSHEVIYPLNTPAQPAAQESGNTTGISKNTPADHTNPHAHQEQSTHMDLKIKEEEEAGPSQEVSEYDHDDFFRMQQERIKRLRQESIKLRSQDGLNEVESQPAYLRRDFKLNQTPSSNSSEISRYTLNSKEGSGITDNSYLHKGVD